MGDERWLVAGLGNPESEYGGTRHNVGADLVRALVAAHRGSLARKKRLRCEIAEMKLEGHPVILAVPSSYMNRAGSPIQAAASFFKVDAANIIVCHDDLDVPVGAIKVKRGGGNAGHNGLRDVDSALGTSDYLRLRIGIGRPPQGMPGRDHVLRRFAPADREMVDQAIRAGGEAVLSLVTDGLEATQNRFHTSG